MWEHCGACTVCQDTRSGPAFPHCQVCDECLPFDEHIGRGLHWFTFQLILSTFCGIGGALRVCSGVILWVFRRYMGDVGGCWGFKGCVSCQIRLR